MDKQSLAGKLVSVMQECSHVGKNGVNSFHNYKYATAEDVLCKVNEALTKYKICSIVEPSLLSLDDVVNQKGNTEHLATISVKVTLIDGATGESVALYGLGSGQDAGDKAIMKAQTAAIKYAYMMSLCIATGDDPEADGKVDEAMNRSKGNNDTLVKTMKPTNARMCSQCGSTITDKVIQYSVSRYGRPLCMDCQKNESKVA